MKALICRVKIMSSEGVMLSVVDLSSEGSQSIDIGPVGFQVLIVTWATAAKTTV